MATKEELRAKLDELNAEQPPADAKKEENEEAGVLNTEDDEQPGRTAPSTTATAAENPRPLKA